MILCIISIWNLGTPWYHIGCNDLLTTTYDIIVCDVICLWYHNLVIFDFTGMAMTLSWYVDLYIFTAELWNHSMISRNHYIIHDIVSLNRGIPHRRILGIIDFKIDFAGRDPIFGTRVDFFNRPERPLSIDFNGVASIDRFAWYFSNVTPKRAATSFKISSNLLFQDYLLERVRCCDKREVLTIFPRMPWKCWTENWY